MTESEQKLCYTNGRRTCVCDIDVFPTPSSTDSAQRQCGAAAEVWVNRVDARLPSVCFSG